LTALSRAFISSPFASRYLYVGAFFVLLIAVELLAGATLPRWAGVAVGVVGVAAIISNIGSLRDAARLYRSNGQTTKAVLGALQIGRPVMPAGYIAQGIPGYPFVIVPAAAYFAAARTVGSPAQTPAQIAADPDPVRASVDNELTHIHRIGLLPVASFATFGSIPKIDSVSGGSAAAHGACVAFKPYAFAPAGSATALAVTVPPQGLVLQVTGDPAIVAVRRFASEFQTVGTLDPGGSAAIRIALDRSSLPWHLQLETAGRAVACGL
jgi:hypothetical protein